DPVATAPGTDLIMLACPRRFAHLQAAARDRSYIRNLHPHNGALSPSSLSSPTERACRIADIFLPPACPRKPYRTSDNSRSHRKLYRGVISLPRFLRRIRDAGI